MLGLVIFRVNYEYICARVREKVSSFTSTTLNEHWTHHHHQHNNKVAQQVDFESNIITLVTMRSQAWFLYEISMKSSIANINQRFLLFTLKFLYCHHLHNDANQKNSSKEFHVEFNCFTLSLTLLLVSMFLFRFFSEFWCGSK